MSSDDREANQALAQPLVKVASDWPIPASLTPRLLSVPPFDDTMFPEAIRPSLRDIAHRMQCPPDWLAVAWIVMMGSVVGNRCGIWPKQHDTSWFEVPNLWGAIVAEPSKLKTPALNAAMGPMKQLENTAKAEFNRQSRLHEADADLLKARKDAIRKRMGKAAEKQNEDELHGLKHELANLEAAEVPVARRYIINDSTVEKLCELLVVNPRGLMVFRDELMGLLSSWEKQGRETDRQFFLEAWNGTGDYSSDRIGRGSLHIPNCCLSLLGGIQPDKLLHYLRESLNGNNDGMTQRFSLLSWPDSRPFKYTDATPDEAAQLQAAELLRRLDALNPIEAGAIQHSSGKRIGFHFDAAAQSMFIEWLVPWQNMLEQSKEVPPLIQHLAKFRKLYPCLALLFHLLDVVDGKVEVGPVSSSAAELAGKWCDYFAAHARRLYAYGCRVTGAATLGEHVKAGDLLERFTLRDVQRKNWQGLNDRGSVQSALDELVEAGWLREMASKIVEQGRPRSTTYETNPRLFIEKG
ncbi:uncharacterized protein DUF3987 [Hymenobacter chitinivorans DSM 11115]|uniref:Uncharacterized protein DUF3987 n=1 Tax=Hymenobacter chitinivorans DSM 11115 TaxID=1121954 RepID=A0A2M9B9I6_9BACT|nr:uncharacterized protein DUF3987 [Hymenobacter chitinivorans DSM 11115]